MIICNTIEQMKRALLPFEAIPGSFVVDLNYQNTDNKNRTCSIDIVDLWKDWWDEALYCPTNDTICNSIAVTNLINHTTLYLSKETMEKEEYTFEDFIDDMCYCLTLEVYY